MMEQRKGTHDSHIGRAKESLNLAMVGTATAKHQATTHRV